MARRNYVAILEDLRRDEHYLRHNLPHREYTDDVVRQWLKHHWEYVEAGRDADDELRCIWIDLTSALESLPAAERHVVRAYAEGYRARALVEATGREDAAALLARGVSGMVTYLRGAR
jgi:hypothetical protein